MPVIFLFQGNSSHYFSFLLENELIMFNRLVLLLLLGILLLATKADPKEQKLNILLLAHIETAIEDAKTLENRTTLKNLTRLRTQILYLGWTFAPLHLENLAAEINNNKFNIEQENCDAKIGLLQLWEKELLDGKKIKTEDFERLHSFLKTLKIRTQTYDWQSNDILAALLLDHYDLYVQTLTGSYHFQEKQIVKDYEHILHLHSLILKTIGNSEELVNQYSAVLQYVKGQKSESLGRIFLLKKYIQPIHNQIIVLLNKDYPEWTNHLNLEEKFFSGKWLKRDPFIDINTSLSRKKLANLGQLLFFDPLLSGNNKRTCASCHQAQKAFSDGRSTSLGFDYLSKLDKNSPSLINSVFNHSFGHDLSKQNLAAQIDFVVHQEQEFRTTYAEIIEKLNSSSEYIQLFQDCFPEKESIDSIQINQALEGYMSTLVSFDSPFDRYMRGEEYLNQQILDGYNLFMGKAECGTCHQAPLFSGMNTIHLEKEQIFLCNESSKVKIPTVRNLSFTMPYFHRGTINSQEELYNLIFYNVQQSIHPNKILTRTEQLSIINFLGSLKDESAVNFDVPKRLPKMEKRLNKMERRAGGVY